MNRVYDVNLPINSSITEIDVSEDTILSNECDEVDMSNC